jgi:hypothetical protein
MNEPDLSMMEQEAQRKGASYLTTAILRPLPNLMMITLTRLWIHS